MRARVIEGGGALANCKAEICLRRNQDPPVSEIASPDDS